MNKKIGAAIVGIMVFQWSSVYWLGPDNLGMARGYTSLSMLKPYVYRQLPSILARLLVSLGVRIDLAIVLLMTGAGIGFYLALRELAFSLYRKDEKAELLLVVLVGVGLVFFGDYRMPYDIFTAWLFTLAFLYIGQGDKTSLAILFPLACLNRETAFLLIILSAIVGILKNDKDGTEGTLLYQTSAFVLIQVLLRTLFYNNGGVDALIEPLENIQRFIARPWITLLHGFVTFGLLKIALQNWTWKPMFLRAALIALLPRMTVMYIVFGQAFEVRVFGEVYPILALLMLPTLHSLKIWRPNVQLVSIRKTSEGKE